MSAPEIVLLLVCAALFAHAEIRAWRSAPDLRRLQEINVRLMEHVMAIGTTARRDATQAYCDLLNAAQGLKMPATMAEHARVPLESDADPQRPQEEIDAEAWAEEQLGILKASGEVVNEQEPANSRA